MDEEGGSNWQERCERYFTSLTDSDKQKQKDLKMKNKRTPKNWNSLAEVDGTGNSNHTFSSKKSSMRYWFRALDFHGIRFAGSVRNSLECVVWVLISITACGAFAFLLYLIISSYISQTPHLQLKPSSTVIKKHPQTLITICNLNLLRKSSISSSQNRFSKLGSIDSGVFNPQPVQTTEQLMKNGELWLLLKNSLKTGTLSYTSELDQEFLPYSGMSASDDWGSLYGASMNYGVQIWTEAVRPTISELHQHGHQPTDIIVQCYIGESRHCPSSSTEYTLPTQGNCATLNISENIDKVSLILNSEPTEYIPISGSLGLSVQVYTADSSVKQSRQHLVAPGHHLTIRNEKMTNIYRTTECSKTISRSVQQCEEDCIDAVTFKHCQCHTDRRQDNQCRVNDKFEYVCSKIVKKLYSLGSLQCACQQKCNETRYETGSETVPWPSPQHLEYLESSLQHKNMNKTTIMSSLSYVTINLRPDIQEELTEEQTITLLDLLSMMGGVSALVVGISIVTVFQLIWLLIKLCFYGVMSRRSNSKGEVEKLEDSVITSITWQANKNKHSNDLRQQRFSFQPDMGSCLIRNNSRRSYLEPIEEERKHEHPQNGLSNDDVIIEDQLFSHPWERTGHRRLYSTTLNSNRGNGGEFPLFNYIDSRSSSPMPRCSTPDNSDYRSTAKLVPNDGDVRLYPARGKMSPADAIKSFGNSTSKYQYSGPFYL